MTFLPYIVSPAMPHVGQVFNFSYSYCTFLPDHWCFH